VGAIVDRLVRRGCRVLTAENSGELVHSTGHACQAEQRMMIELVRPRSFVPIHGEYRMLEAHARLASSAGVDKRGCVLAEDGDVIELGPGAFASKAAERAPSGRLFLDARGAGSDVGEVALRDRQLLADSGLLICLCVLDRKSGEVVHGPELLGKGVSGLDDRRLARAAGAAREALLELAATERTDRASVEEALRRGARSAWKKGAEKRPMVLPVVIEL
jgi:ribonuclease J